MKPKRLLPSSFSTMAFRENKQIASMLGLAERWLRRIFVEDWSLKLLALAITLALWFFVSGHGSERLLSGRESEREVVVEPRIEGKPAPTFEVKEVIATPGKIKVQGPADRVSTLDRVQTQPISIEGRRESFDVPQIPIYVSDPKVAPLGAVSVHVTIVAIGSSRTQSRDTN